MKHLKNVKFFDKRVLNLCLHLEQLRSCKLQHAVVASTSNSLQCRRICFNVECTPSAQFPLQHSNIWNPHNFVVHSHIAPIKSLLHFSVKISVSLNRCKCHTCSFTPQVPRMCFHYTCTSAFCHMFTLKVRTDI